MKSIVSVADKRLNEAPSKGDRMQAPPFTPSEAYVHEHVRPEDSRLKRLKSEIDAHNLTEMWDMILTLDYQVSNTRELPYEAKEEFFGIIELLLKAFVK